MDRDISVFPCSLKEGMLAMDHITAGGPGAISSSEKSLMRPVIEPVNR